MDIIYIATYFLIYCFVGWCLDTILRSIQEKKISRGGFMYSPFSPIYGIPAIILVLLMNHLKNWNVFELFLIGFIVLTFWEAVVWVILDKLFKRNYRDYSKRLFNYKGIVCLETSLVWGIVVALFVKIIHPLVEKWVEMIPYNVLFYVVIILYIVLFIDWIFSIIRYTKLKKK